MSAAPTSPTPSPPSPDVTYHLVESPDPADAIRRLAEDLSADLIVCARRRKPGPELLGKTLERLTRLADCSLLVVGPGSIPRTG